MSRERSQRYTSLGHLWDLSVAQETSLGAPWGALQDVSHDELLGSSQSGRSTIITSTV
ncbi:hypothetical protein CROQUDRAFT_88444 [Cronartium quercuum f. sp. fusiforme G11]|uniref:Uncharacterized protein n=1 Tax=Cronartium quercuum f. sp. fusiforme G11 TaxID=708437 RepID=A0A9P6NQ48_9BASI|nr:hypothetical protein CROQUDRAFT_88444 [Cronartium quercuum f. sp. fusiforme G11]